MTGEELRMFSCLLYTYSLIEEGGDWDRRNRLKVYQGVYSIAVRDFKTAANLFLDTISTFTSYELMDYITFVRYTVYVSMISLPRNQLRDKVKYNLLLANIINMFIYFRLSKVLKFSKYCTLI